MGLSLYDHRKLCVTRFPALFCFKKKIVATWHLGGGKGFSDVRKFGGLQMASDGFPLVDIPNSHMNGFLVQITSRAVVWVLVLEIAVESLHIRLRRC